MPGPELPFDPNRQPLPYDNAAGAPIAHPGIGGSYRDNVSPGPMEPEPRAPDPKPFK